MIDVALIIGNLLGLASTLLRVGSGLAKRRQTSILLHLFHGACCASGDLVLGGYSGAIVDGVSMVRDGLGYRNQLTQRRKYILIFLVTALILFFNNLGWIGLLPLVSAVFFTLTISIQDPVRYKLCLMLTMVLGLIYSLAIRSYVGAAVQVVALVGGAISLVRLRRERETKATSQQ